MMAGLLALAGCGADPDPQSSPEAVVEAIYEHLAAGDFGEACELLLPETRSAITAAGSNCQAGLARLYPPEVRAGFKEVKVDSDLVEQNGDTARVPREAVTFDGNPSQDSDTQTVREDDKWWVTTSA